MMLYNGVICAIYVVILKKYVFQNFQVPKCIEKSWKITTFLEYGHTDIIFLKPRVTKPRVAKPSGERTNMSTILNFQFPKQTGVCEKNDRPEIRRQGVF